jgi:fermentation-respiration switch protein FrsA (DUF1100 family)
MAGEDSETAFDRAAPLHDLRGDIAEVRCPLLIVQGEFDELCTPQEVEAILGKATSPYEFRIYEDEFHPLGGVALEAYEGAADWLKDRLDGKPTRPSFVRSIPRA